MSERFVSDLPDARLLISVAEQLRQPLTVMGRYADLALIQDSLNLDPHLIKTQSRAALTLVDTYLLGLQMLTEQQSLELEPVSVSSVLIDSAHMIEDFAKQYGVQVEVNIEGRYGPVIANQKALKAALSSLSLAMIEGAAQQEGLKLIAMSVHSTPRGIVTGLYGFDQLTAADWRRALDFKGTAHQPFASLTAGSAAGVFVADALVQFMGTRLRVGKRKHKTGLAFTLQPSQQLQLI